MSAVTHPNTNQVDIFINVLVLSALPCQPEFCITQILSNGSTVYSLTINDPTELPKDVSFVATSTDNGVEMWRSTAVQPVPAVIGM